MEKDLQSRKIIKQEGHDILRWGYSNKGTFNIKEAYKLVAEENQEHFSMKEDMDMAPLA